MQNVKHGMLRNDVYKKLRDHILNQDYDIGDALTESKITKDLGVSRTPVREAFAQLQIDGLVDIIPNKGVVVRGLTKNDMHDMYDIRAYIEGASARRSCNIISKEDIQKLEEILDNEKEIIEKSNFSIFLDSDFDFHYVIIKSINSRIFENLLTSMMEYTKSARRNSLLFGARCKSAYEEHRMIFNAIKERNEEQTQLLMETHIINAKNSFILSS